MVNLLEKVLSNPLNKKVIDFIELDKGSSLVPFEQSTSMYYEQREIFHANTIELPANVKYVKNAIGLLIIPKTGYVFGFTYGRFNFVFRYSIGHYNVNNSDDLRVLKNLDGIYEDIRFLGENWAFLLHFVGDEVVALNRAYNKADML